MNREENGEKSLTNVSIGPIIAVNFPNWSSKPANNCMHLHKIESQSNPFMVFDFKKYYLYCGKVCDTEDPKLPMWSRLLCLIYSTYLLTL